jgi:hypothetical protein
LRIRAAFFRARYKRSADGDVAGFWEANDLYRGARQSAQINDPAIQSQYLDLLYGDPATRGVYESFIVPQFK